MAKKRKIFTYGYADADSNLRALRYAAGYASHRRGRRGS
jgi:hypothetical protein